MSNRKRLKNVKFIPAPKPLPIPEKRDEKPRINGYHCTSCNKIYLTRDIDEGVTPMFMTCLRTEGCGGQAISMGYPHGEIPPGLPLLIEWVKPTQEEIERKGIKHPGLIDHFNRGGLMRRATEDAPDWVKALV